MSIKRIVLPNKILNKALVRHREEITAGPYIRAVVNCYGWCWLEYLVVEGKPFFDHDLHSSFSPWKIYVKGHANWIDKDNSYFASTLVGYKEAQAFRYSNRVWNIFNSTLKLQVGYKRQLKPQREFCDLLRSKPFTDKEWGNQIDDWGYQKYSDDRMYSDRMEEAQNREIDRGTTGSSYA